MTPKRLVELEAWNAYDGPKSILGDPMAETLSEVRRSWAEIEKLENALHQLADWPERKKTGLSIDELEAVIDELEDHLVYVHKCVRPSLVARVHARSKTNEGAIPK